MRSVSAQQQRSTTPNHSFINPLHHLIVPILQSKIRNRHHRLHQRPQLVDKDPLNLYEQHCSYPLARRRYRLSLHLSDHLHGYGHHRWTISPILNRQSWRSQVQELGKRAYHHENWYWRARNGMQGTVELLGNGGGRGKGRSGV